MTRVRALDAVGDFTFGSGLNNYKQGNAAISQNINTRLNSFLGNCFFDLTAGIDWFNLLGSKNQTQLQLQIAMLIRNTEGVQNIIQLAFNLSPEREFTITYQVQTVYSVISNNFTFTTTVG